MQRKSAEEIAARGQALGLLQRVALALFRWYLALPPVASRLEGAWAIWGTDNDLAPRCPMLFLYSAADSIVDAEQVEAFAALQVRSRQACNLSQVIRKPLLDAHCGVDASHTTNQCNARTAVWDEPPAACPCRKHEAAQYLCKSGATPSMYSTFGASLTLIQPRSRLSAKLCDSHAGVKP